MKPTLFRCSLLIASSCTEVFDASLACVMWGGEPFSKFSFANETAHRFERVRVTNTMGGLEMGIVEIKLMENPK